MKTKFLIILFAMMSNLNIYSAGQKNPVALEEFEKIIQLTSPLIILDVRTPEEFSEAHIPGAINIDFFDKGFVDKVKKAIPIKTPVALYCKSGNRSAKASEMLKNEGYDICELQGGILAWEKAELPVTDDKLDFYFTKDGKKIEIQTLIHASIRIDFEGKEIEIDPVGQLGDRTTDYSAFPKADLILVTHEHHDHLDPKAIQTLSKADTLLITNANSAKILGYGDVMKNGDKKVVSNDIQIEAVPAYNVSPDRLQFHPKGRDNGYILNLDGIKIYIAGDTEVIPEMENIKDMDISFLPCNLPYTMTPEQLIKAAEIIRPKVLYPYHFGTTDLSSITPALAPLGIYVRIRPFDP